MKLEEVRAAVQASGELVGIDGPQFLADATSLSSWSPFHIGNDHPVAARVTVTRKGQAPREVVIVWDEYADEMENNPEWNATRDRKPTAVFGGEAERHGYRVVFADILAPLIAAETQPSAPPPADPWARSDEGDPAIFLALKLTETEADVDAVWALAKGHRTAALERACRQRKAELRAAAAIPAVPLPRAEKVASVPKAPTVARVPVVESRPMPAPRPPTPQRDTAISRALAEAEQASGKTVSRKAQSRGQRDSGRRGGGQR
ncbi:hypothetical protein [Microbacterium rhizomatis]|uniref:Uncharacterized protein n=1 Tax=Microbacterium rhizomatis TaxID=1631477 RepID=A0A5J5J288_9MICO|nr:hypothetical protein [Microbacterium rhizomatis]KAA9110160.1 hypothetical protein F6B43_00155 [Microbacterium rhizomatis]